MTSQELDRRELITMDYSLMDAEQLEALKRSIMRSINQAEDALPEWHREYTAIRLALKAKQAQAEGEQA